MSSGQSGAARRTRILIADDEPNIRLLYQNELEAEGYEVLLAEDGREAVEKVRSEKPDLVVLDIRMPGMDGIEALGRILDHDRTLPVILNTAYSTYEDDFMTWSADAYIVKSADVGVLLAKIAEVLAGRRGAGGEAPAQGGGGGAC
ncbi:MAG: response regulator [Planctomycetes bacterium]|nr:response regulator [Planctomycetota bacterium]